MRKHPSQADERLAALCRTRGINVSDRVVQSMKERGALRPPPSKVEPYPKGAENVVGALIRNGWRRKARWATFLTFMEGFTFTAKGVRWAIGTPLNPFPEPVSTTGKSEEEIDREREKYVDTLVNAVTRSRNPYYVRFRKRLRHRGIDPAAAAYDLAQAVAGEIPPVEVETYEPTTDEFRSEPPPWVFRMLGMEDALAEWDRDPEHVAQDLRNSFRAVGDPDLLRHLGDGLARATEEQMANARDRVHRFLQEVPGAAGADDGPGTALTFLIELANVVGTLDWRPDHDHAGATRAEGGSNQD
jgi:hypothetical protein